MNSIYFQSIVVIVFIFVCFLKTKNKLTQTHTHTPTEHTSTIPFLLYSQIFLFFTDFFKQNKICAITICTILFCLCVTQYNPCKKTKTKTTCMHTQNTTKTFTTQIHTYMKITLNLGVRHVLETHFFIFFLLCCMRVFKCAVWFWI